MDEARYIDWYPVVDAVANGKVDNHPCPECHGGPLAASSDGVTVRLVCPACGMGFEGRLAHGRDDGFYAEADRIMAAWAARKQPGAAAQPAADGQPAAPQAAEPAPGEPAAAAAPPITRSEPAPPAAEEPWDWDLPPGQGRNDEEALSAWMPVIEAVHNGRRVGLVCPFCSEPLEDFTVRSPYLRVRCMVCGETFEGRIG